MTVRVYAEGQWGHSLPSGYEFIPNKARADIWLVEAETAGKALQEAAVYPSRPMVLGYRYDNHHNLFYIRFDKNGDILDRSYNLLSVVPCVQEDGNLEFIRNLSQAIIRACFSEDRQTVLRSLSIKFEDLVRHLESCDICAAAIAGELEERVSQRHAVSSSSVSSEEYPVSRGTLTSFWDRGGQPKTADILDQVRELLDSDNNTKE